MHKIAIGVCGRGFQVIVSVEINKAEIFETKACCYADGSHTVSREDERERVVGASFRDSGRSSPEKLEALANLSFNLQQQPPIRSTTRSPHLYPSRSPTNQHVLIVLENSPNRILHPYLPPPIPSRPQSVTKSTYPFPQPQASTSARANGFPPMQ